MPHFILHIGTHKTATTSLQGALSNNREMLLEQGVDFPLLGRIEQGSQAHRHFAAYFRGQMERVPDTFKKQIIKPFTQSKECIISAEAFYFSHKKEIIDDIAKCFGNDTTVVCYFREPAEHIVSLYKEALKGIEIETFANFIERYRNSLGANSFSYYDYERNSDSWKYRFSNFRTVIYERSMGDIVESFFSACGIDVDTSGFSRAKNENVSIGSDQAELLRRINRMLKNGRIDSGKRAFMKRRIIGQEYDKAAVSYEIEEVSLQAFLEAFRQRNPSFLPFWFDIDGAGKSSVQKTCSRIHMSDDEICEMLSV